MDRLQGQVKKKIATHRLVTHRYTKPIPQRGRQKFSRYTLLGNHNSKKTYFYNNSEMIIIGIQM
jgi:hypothetical protein